MVGGEGLHCTGRQKGETTADGLLQSWDETVGSDLEEERERCRSTVSLPASLVFQNFKLH